MSISLMSTSDSGYVFNPSRVDLDRVVLLIRVILTQVITISPRERC